MRAYDAHCRRWCSPLWIAPGWLGLQTVARRTAYVGRAGRIDAYSTRCRADGGRCAPAFRIPQLDPVLRQTDYATELRLDSPVVGANETYVAAGETAGSSHPADGQGRVFAFPLTCDVTCAPIWKTPLYDGTLAAQPHGRRVYVASNEGLAVFAKGCQNGGRTCRPIWSGPIDADISNVVGQPVIGNGLVLVNVGHDVGGGDGRPTGVYVFTTRCDAPVCRARRFIPWPMFSRPPQIIHRRIYVVSYARGQWVVRAFSTRCGRPGGACRVVWGAPLRERGELELTPAGSLAYLRATGGRVAALPTRCRDTVPIAGGVAGESCRPTWTFHPSVGWRWLRSQFVLGPRGTLLVQSRKTLFALLRRCGDPCSPVWEWTSPSPMRIGHVAGRRIFVTHDTYDTDEPKTVVLRIPR